MKTLKEFETQVFESVNPAVRFSVTRYVLAIGFFVAVLVFGFVSILNLGVDLLPSVNNPVVVVNTAYSGATPEVVETQVTKVIENVVSSLSGITDINSTSQSGSSRVVIFFEPSTDRNSAANQVAAVVSAAVRRLPSGVSAPSIQTFDPNSQPILQFGVYGEGVSLEDVSTYVQNDLSPLVERVSGVANIQIDGAPTRQFQVLLNPNQLASYGITPSQVVTAVTNSALNEPIGTIISQNKALTFVTKSQPVDISQIGGILVDNARAIVVKDLAAVRDVAVPSTIARVNGTPAVLVSIQKTSDANSVAVVDRVRTLLTGIRLPDSYELVFSNDTTGPIKASIDATFRELITTAIVVAIIILLFLGRLNTAFSVILAIPIALSAAPILYGFLGFTFNLVSMLALIVAIGIVVDDSIVVAENVERYKAMGYNLKESVFRGASEVFSSVVAASLSLLSVLLPVSFIGGFVGRYVQQFSLGLAAAVAFSLVEAILFLTVRLAYTPDVKEVRWPDAIKCLLSPKDALTWGFRNWYKPLGLLPALAGLGVLAWFSLYYFMPLFVLYPLALGISVYVLKTVYYLAQALAGSLHRATEATMDWLRGGYARSVNRMLDKSLWVLLGALGLLVATVLFVAPHIPFNFVPQNDSGTMQVNLRMPSGSPALITNAQAGKLEKFLLSQPEVLMVQTVINSNNGQATGANIKAVLAPVEERPSIFDMIPSFRTEMLALLRGVTGARVSVSVAGTGFGGGGGGTTLELNLISSDKDLLTSVNDSVVKVLETNPYLTDVQSSLDNKSLINGFEPDLDKIAGTGITPNQIAQTLKVYTTGTEASTLQKGGVSYPILVKIDPTFLKNSQSLLNLPIWSSALGTNLQASQLGYFIADDAPLNITRANRLYTAELTLTLRPDAPAVLELQQMIEDSLNGAGLLGQGVGLNAGSSRGSAALAAELARQGPVLFALALFLAYLVMGAQFNSWKYPIYLLIPVPLAVIGALWLVFVMGSGLDIFGVLGMLLLIGLSAKNAILYLDFVVERIDKMPLRDALTESASLRFRPIIMTTLTILVISFPLIFGHGQGSEFGRKLGIVMLGGIVSSAVLTFFVVPAAFYFFERKTIAKQQSLKPLPRDEDELPSKVSGGSIS